MVFIVYWYFTKQGMRWELVDKYNLNQRKVDKVDHRHVKYPQKLLIGP